MFRNRIKLLTVRFEFWIGGRTHSEGLKRSGRILFNKIPRNEKQRYKIDHLRLVHLRKYNRKIPYWIAKRIDELDARDAERGQHQKDQSAVQSRGEVLADKPSSGKTLGEKCMKTYETTPPTKRQLFIRDFIQAQQGVGVSPTVREIGKFLGITINGVSNHLRAMERRGLIVVDPGKPRGIHIIRSCRVCGCTDNHACEGGCEWVENEYNLCSKCQESYQEKKNKYLEDFYKK